MKSLPRDFFEVGLACRARPFGANKPRKHARSRSASETYGSTAVRAGFSLLEIILAMAVLAGSLAILGEAANLAMRNAQYTRDMSRAQSLCESTLDEIIAGFIPADPVQQTPVDTSDTDIDQSDTGWCYSIDQQAVDDEVGLLSLRVTVTQDLPPEQHPVSFSVTRWIPDPSAATNGTGTGSSSTGSSDITPSGGSL